MKFLGKVIIKIHRLSAFGKSTGIVIEIGFERSTISCIYENNILHQTIKNLSIGGKHVTNSLR